MKVFTDGQGIMVKYYIRDDKVTANRIGNIPFDRTEAFKKIESEYNKALGIGKKVEGIKKLFEEAKKEGPKVDVLSLLRKDKEATREIMKTFPDIAAKLGRMAKGEDIALTKEEKTTVRESLESIRQRGIAKPEEMIRICFFKHMER